LTEDAYIANSQNPQKVKNKEKRFSKKGMKIKQSPFIYAKETTGINTHTSQIEGTQNSAILQLHKLGIHK